MHKINYEYLALMYTIFYLEFFLNNYISNIIIKGIINNIILINVAEKILFTLYEIISIIKLLIIINKYIEIKNKIIMWNTEKEKGKCAKFWIDCIGLSRPCEPYFVKMLYIKGGRIIMLEKVE